MRSLDISTRRERDGRLCIVAVRGDLDVAGVDRVRRALTQAADAQPVTLALDLREVDHIDSSGLRVMLDADARAFEAGGRLVLVATPEGAVGRLLALTMLTDHFEIVSELVAIRV